MPEHHYELTMKLWVEDGAYFPEWVQKFIDQKLNQPENWDDIGSQVVAMFMGAIDDVHGMGHEEASIAYLWSTESIGSNTSPITSITGNVINVDFREVELHDEPG
jgi:hypothetical protein